MSQSIMGLQDFRQLKFHSSECRMLRKRSYRSHKNVIENTMTIIVREVFLVCQIQLLCLEAKKLDMSIFEFNCR